MTADAEPVPTRTNLNSRVEPVGGARWCEQHQRYECTKQRRRGRGPCHKPAIRGTSSCNLHAGISLDQARAKGEVTITAWSAMGGRPDVDHRQVMLALLQVTWLRWHLYAELLEAQVAAAGGVTTGRQVDGLIGWQVSSGGPEGLYETGERLRGLAQLESRERDRAMQYAKTVHDAGIADAVVRLEQDKARLSATAFAKALDAAGLTTSQRETAIRVLMAELRVAAAGEVQG